MTYIDIRSLNGLANFNDVLNDLDLNNTSLTCETHDDMCDFSGNFIEHPVLSEKVESWLKNEIDKIVRSNLDGYRHDYITMIETYIYFSEFLYESTLLDIYCISKSDCIIDVPDFYDTIIKNKHESNFLMYRKSVHIQINTDKEFQLILTNYEGILNELVRDCPHFYSRFDLLMDVYSFLKNSPLHDIDVWYKLFSFYPSTEHRSYYEEIQELCDNDPICMKAFLKLKLTNPEMSSI